MSASMRRSARVQASAVTGAITSKVKATTPKKRSRASAGADSVVSTNGVKNEETEFKMPATPSPAKKRRSAPSLPRPPMTPTPSAIGVMFTPGPRNSYSTGDVDDAPPPVIRTADPHMTNAPLHNTANGDIELAHTVPPARSSTTTLLQEAKQHLISVDPSLRRLVEGHHCHVFDPEGLAEVIDPFRSLSSGIMSQQVSGAAARSIKNKFIGLFPASGSHPGPPVFPSPSLVAATDLGRLREAGLSQRKAEYIQGLAEKFSTGELTAEMLADASDEEVMERLVAVRGLGKWSVEMFMTFGLKRMDCFSTGDLGVQRGMAVYKGRDVAKLKNKGGKWKYMSEQEMIEVAEQFRPYRSLFMWYMWRIEDTIVDALESNA